MWIALVFVVWLVVVMLVIALGRDTVPDPYPDPYLDLQLFNPLTVDWDKENKRLARNLCDRGIEITPDEVGRVRIEVLGIICRRLRAEGYNPAIEMWKQGVNFEYKSNAGGPC